MKQTKILLVFAALLTASFSFSQTPTAKPSPFGGAQQGASLAGSSVFIENKGQLADSEGKVLTDVLFNLRLPGMDVYFRKTGLSFVLIQNSEPAKQSLANTPAMLGMLDEVNTSAFRMDLTWQDANNATDLEAQQAVSEYFNYYYGHCPDGINFVKGYEKLVYHNVYKGIDFVFYLKPVNGIPQLEYDIVVHPGADPNVIKLKYNTGGVDLVTNENALQIQTPLGLFTETLGEVYQLNDAKEVANPSHLWARREVLQGTYQLSPLPFGEGRGGALAQFKIANHDPSLTLIIDPFFTYYGTASTDIGEEIVADSKDNVIVLGSTQAAGLSVTSPGYTQNYAGSMDFFVVKLNRNGIRLWSTYYGGNADEFPGGIDVDATDNIFIGGNTWSSNFPTSTPGVLQGTTDAVLVSFDGNGLRRWAILYSGNSQEAILDLTIDNNSAVVVCGISSSVNLPVAGCLPSSYQGGNAYIGDGFIARFNNANGVQQWGTYVGGTNNDYCFGVTVDNNNNVVVTGTTASSNFIPALTGAKNAQWDVFVLQFNADPNCMFNWGVLFGGNGLSEESGWAVDTDPNNNDIVVTGETSSTNFPVLNGQYYMGGSSSTFLTKFKGDGTMLWSSYYPGVAGSDVKLDGAGTIWLTGNITSSSLSTSATSFQQNYGGGTFDAFVAHIATDGVTTLCATYYGGSNLDKANGLALDNIGHVLITGETKSTNLPGVNATSLQTANAGGSDAFIASMCQNCGLPQDSAFIVGADTLPYAKNPVLFCLGDTVHLMNLFDFTSTLGNKSVNYNVNQATFSWYDTTNNIPANLTDLTVKAVAPDSAWIKVSPTDTTTYRLISVATACRIDTSYITVVPLPKPSITYTDKQDTICPNSTHDFVVNLTGLAPWTLEIKKPGGTVVNHYCPGTPCTIAATDPGDYVIQKITDDQCDKKLTDTLRLVPRSISATLTGGAMICKGDSVLLKVSLTGTAPWRFKVILNNITASPYAVYTNVTGDISFWVKQNGFYKIDSVYDAFCGYKANTSTTVSVKPKPTAKITNTTDSLFICPYNTATINLALTGTPPFNLYYRTPINNASLLPTNSTTPNLVVVDEGWYILDSIVDANGCDSTLKDSIYVKHHTLPNATFTVSKDTICLGDSALYTLNLSGTSPFKVTSNSNLGTPSPNTPNPWSIWLQPSTTTVYALTRIEDKNCKVDTLMDTTIVVRYKPTISSSTTCNAASTHFTLTVSLSPNNPPNTVTEILPGGTGPGNWDVTSNTWTSDLIPVGPYEFNFDDKNGCGPIKISGNKVCNCITRAGTVNTTPQQLCLTQNTNNAHNADAVLDGNDTLEFLLTGPTLIAQNNTGIFSFDASKGMSCGTTYYITAVAGNKLAGNDSQVDPGDGCYSTTASVPVIWHCTPTLSVSHPDSVCAGSTAQITLDLQGSLANFDIGLNGNAPAYLNVADGYMIPIVVNGDTTVTITSVAYSNSPQCSQSLNTSVAIKVFALPTVPNASTFSCNSSSTQYQVSFSISGGDSIFVTPAGGNLAGTTYTSGWINSCDPYSFQVNDRHNCTPVAVTGSHCCTCISDAGTAQNFDTLSACGADVVSYPHKGNSLLDDTDGLSYILHTGSSWPIGNFIDRNTTGTFAFNANKGMLYDVVYVITPVAGNKLATDSVNMADPCLSIGDSIPVIFRKLPTITSIGVLPNDSVCAGTAITIPIQFDGTGPFNVNYNLPPFTSSGLAANDQLNLGILNNSDSVKISTVTDQYCTATANEEVGIAVSPAFSATSVVNQIPCIDSVGSINLTVNGGFGGNSYQWTDINGSVVGNDSAVLITNQPGVYRLAVRDYLGCTATFTDSLVQPPLFGINFIALLNEMCFASSDGSITVTAQDGKQYKLDGTVSKVWQSSNVFVSLHYEPGLNTLTITVESPNGCIADSTVYMTGLYPITLSASANQTICPGDCILLTADGDGGNGNFRYTWNDGLSWLTPADTIVCPLGTTTYIVRAEDSRGCPSANDTITITVPQPLTQSISTYPNDTVCAGEVVFLSTTPAGGTGSPTFTWVENSSSNQVGNTKNYSFTASSTDVYTITTSDTCGSSVSDKLLITVIPAAAVSFTPLQDAESCTPLVVDFVNQSTGNYDQCFWNISGSPTIPDNSCAGIQHVFSTPGFYNVSLTVRDLSSGCSSSSPTPTVIFARKSAKSEFSYEPDKVTLLDPKIKTFNHTTNADTYIWTIDWVFASDQPEPELFFSPDKEGSYLVCLDASKDAHCNDTTCTTIIVKDEVTLFVPNSFSPNGDGYNESFSAKGAGFDENFFTLEIYNRWGELVFSNSNINQAWDGTIMGTAAKSDIYQWKIVTRAKNSSVKVVKTGAVSLIR